MVEIRGGVPAGVARAGSPLLFFRPGETEAAGTGRLRVPKEANGRLRGGTRAEAVQAVAERGQFGADCFHCHGGPLFQSQAFSNNGLDSDFSDLGRSIVTGKEGDKGKFAVPSLRNVEITAPHSASSRVVVPPAEYRGKL